MTERMARALKVTGRVAGTALSMPASRAMPRMVQPHGEDKALGPDRVVKAAG